MRTSREAVYRLLDPMRTGVTLDSLQRAASALGFTLNISFARSARRPAARPEGRTRRRKKASGVKTSRTWDRMVSKRPKNAAQGVDHDGLRALCRGRPGACPGAEPDPGRRRVPPRIHCSAPRQGIGTSKRSSLWRGGCSTTERDRPRAREDGPSSRAPANLLGTIRQRQWLRFAGARHRRCRCRPRRRRP
jgi:hypothetical protein